MRRAAALVGVGCAIALAIDPVAARADLVRGAIKVDVRDASGAPAVAKVSVAAEAGGEARPVARQGDVWVADGLYDGNWVVDVEGAGKQVVRVHGRRTVGAVAVLSAAIADHKIKKKSRGAAAQLTVGPDERACDAADGIVVEAVAFAGGALAAGRVDVKRGGKLYCSATVAGGGATLLLPPGDYVIDGRFVGGKKAEARYQLRADRPVKPLVLQAR